MGINWKLCLRNTFYLRLKPFNLPTHYLAGNCVTTKCPVTRPLIPCVSQQKYIQHFSNTAWKLFTLWCSSVIVFAGPRHPSSPPVTQSTDFLLGLSTSCLPLMSLRGQPLMLTESSKYMSTFPSAKLFNHMCAACGCVCLLMYTMYMNSTWPEHMKLTASVSLWILLQLSPCTNLG